MQETCLLIQATVLRAASLYFHRGLRKCFAKDYARLFDSPVNSRLDNDVSSRSPKVPTFEPPVDDATFIALSPAKDFFYLYLSIYGLNLSLRLINYLT